MSRPFSILLAASPIRPRLAVGMWALAGSALLLAATAARAGVAEPAVDVAPPAAAMDPPAAVSEPAPPVSPPRWSTSAELIGGNYRWSLSRGNVDFGLRFETPSRLGVVAGSPLETSGPMVQTLPALSLDLRTVDLPNSTWLQRLAGNEAKASSSSRLGIEWKPADSNLMFLRQGLGVRLSGDDRLTMRLRKGTLGIYMKREF